MKLIRIEAISSKTDSSGNRYHAAQVTNLLTNKSISFTICGDNVEHIAYTLFGGDWAFMREFCDFRTTEMGARSFHATTKRWARGGSDESILNTIRTGGLLPTFYEAISAYCADNGIEINNRESDLYVPVSPAITRLCDAYGKKGSLRSTFVDNISGKLSYDIPFAYEPHWATRTSI